MKFSCTQENLYNGLNLATHVANRSTSLPILSNVLLRTTKTGLELTATNLEVAVITTIRGKVEQEGSVAVSGRLISDSVSLLPSARVDIELKDGNLILDCARHHTVIRGMSAEEFPVIPQTPQTKGNTVSAKELEAALTQVSFAVNSEESRPEISGVYFWNSENNLVIAGTDSYRLAEKVLAGVSKQGAASGFIVPLRAVQEVMRVAGVAQENEVEIIANDTQVVWCFGETKIISRLIAGQYPDYRQLIPKEFSTTVTVLRDDLVRAVKSASLFSRAGVNDVRLTIEKTSNLIRVFSANSQLGENITELNPKNIKGQDNEVAFNYRYLLDGLQAIKTSEVLLEIVDPKKPGILRALGDESYLYLIMPIRQ